jgi:hypothetical protein
MVGVSLLAHAFQPSSDESWDRASLVVEPRLTYRCLGRLAVHSIPPLDRHRYSISFCTLVRCGTG